jgi:tryptophan synthase beta chain
VTKKILLGENDIPERWYNILPDMPAPPAPYLNPQTLQPMGPPTWRPSSRRRSSRRGVG